MTDKPKLITGQSVTWNEAKQAVYYSNLMGIAMTPFDLGIIFGQIGPATPSNIEGLVQAKILISPEQASNLIKLLTHALAQYQSLPGNETLRTAGDLNVESFLKELEGNLVKPE